MTTNFSFTKDGLSVTFRDLSVGVPVGSTYHWDFGDFRVSEEVNPTHIYEREGFYEVSLLIETPEPPEDPSIVKPKVLRLGVSDLSKTQLSDSIYNLINSYVPEDLLPYLSDVDKQSYIEKWQLYICPLVDRECGKEIPLDQYNNEFAYEALENQLIMELSVYDYISVGILNMMRGVTKVIQDESSTTVPDTTGDNGGKVKSITTGPTEVQFYEGMTSESAALVKAVTTALQPGGFVDTLKQNLCMLAGRLNIYLPICNQPRRTTAPKVVNRRKPKPLAGPNPFEVLR